MKILHANAFGVIIDDDKIEPLKEYAKEALKEALIAFKGSLILVSHDPSFYDFVDEVINVEDFTLKIV